MKRKKPSHSIETFKREIDYTKNLVDGLLVSGEVLRRLSDNVNIKNSKEFDEKYKKYCEFDDKKVNSIYELGFIRLYACFEAFMYDYLRELYTIYPSSLPRDKKIEIEYIIDWTTKKSIKEFLIDHVAIENSYDLSMWLRTIENQFGLKIFKTEEEKKPLFLLNMYRNTLLHSGGQFNSKVVRDASKFIDKKEIKATKSKSSKFEVSKLELKNLDMLNMLHSSLSKIISVIEKNHA